MVKSGVILFLFCLLVSSGQAQNYESFEALKEQVISRTIPLISVEDLKKVEKTKTPLIILDAREKKEFDVSHIRNAINIGYEKVDLSPLEAVNKETIVVVYCSVGYRSEKIGEKLKDEGFKNVLNLSGGVFDWVNKGFPVYDNKENRTNKIHAYNQNWGKWLIIGEKIYE